MKKTISFLILAIAIIIGSEASAQPGTENFTVVNVQSLKTKWPEKGSPRERDSLIAIYNANVVGKNQYVLSHRELQHWFTGSNKDYLIIEEYKDFDSMTKAFETYDDLEKKAWPDETKRKDFLEKMGSYFEDWHGDALYRMNPKLSK